MLRVATVPRPAVLIRLVTIGVTLVLVMLVVLGVHHVQTSQGESGHPVLTEFGTAHQPVAEPDADAPEIALAEQTAMGQAGGCTALIICGVSGLALLVVGAWRADLFRRLGIAAPPLRAIVIAAAPTALGVGAPPGLIALSISRT